MANKDVQGFTEKFPKYGEIGLKLLQLEQLCEEKGLEDYADILSNVREKGDILVQSIVLTIFKNHERKIRGTGKKIKLLDDLHVLLGNYHKITHLSSIKLQLTTNDLTSILQISTYKDEIKQKIETRMNKKRMRVPENIKARVEQLFTGMLIIWESIDVSTVVQLERFINNAITARDDGELKRDKEKHTPYLRELESIYQTTINRLES